jgi:hypothetical protein
VNAAPPPFAMGISSDNPSNLTVAYAGRAEAKIEYPIHNRDCNGRQKSLGEDLQNQNARDGELVPPAS